LVLRLNRVFYGWWIVAISFIVNTVPCGLYFLGFSVFFLPISRDLNITRAAASLPFSLARFISGAQSPFIGILTDRIGHAQVLFVSTLLAGLGFVLLSQVHSYFTFNFVFLLLLAPAFQGGFDAPAFAATNQWFVRRRGLAISITFTGLAFGGAVITPILALAIDRFGWRPTALVAGIALWVVLLPLSTRYYRSPESRGLLPDGDPPPTTTRKGPQGLLPNKDFTVREAFTNATFWILASSYAFRGMAMTGLLLHMVAIMVWKGISESTAGLLVGVMALSWIVALLIMGWAGNRWPRHRVAAVGGYLGALGMLPLILLDQVSIGIMVVVFVMLAFNEASWAQGWTMLAEQFGRRNFGVIRGGVMALVGFASIGTPYFAGWTYDTFNGYMPLIIPASALFTAAGVLNWVMPQARRPPPLLPR
jgi:MFS family permease